MISTLQRANVFGRGDVRVECTAACRVGAMNNATSDSSLNDSCWRYWATASARSLVCQPPSVITEKMLETYTNDVLGFGSNVKSGRLDGSNVEVSQISTSSSEELMVRSKPLIVAIPALKAPQTTPTSDCQSSALVLSDGSENIPCGCLERTKRRADSSRSHCGYSLFATSDRQSSSPLGQRRVRRRTLKLHCRLLPKWGEGIQSIESGSESRIKIFGRLKRQGCYVLESRQAISNAELFSSELFHPSFVD
jgi:hypothetical protein